MTLNKRIFTSIASLALGSVIALSASADEYKVPRLSNGQPDLQGIWTNSSLTQLTRSPRFKSPTITEAQAAQIERARETQREAALKPTDPNAPAPKAGDTGGYNSFWIDSGVSFAKVKGEIRVSWLVDPADGQLPYTEKGKKILASESARFRDHVDNPEGRPLAERCIIGFGSTGGPPMLNVLYNNYYQFVQSDDSVAILVEMNHDARIIRLNDQHMPATMSRWLGDSVGRWDGDTLVVTTKHFNPGEQLRLYYNNSIYLSQDAIVEERFTRVSDDEIFYEFAVTDPEIYTQTWRAEMSMRSVEDQMFEYACHEGNYAMPNILMGARVEERRAAEGK